MVNGNEEIGVRGSTCSKVFIVGAGAPGGVSIPCPKLESGKNKAARVIRDEYDDRMTRSSRIM